MYEAFFNLRKKPFDLVPDPEFIYLSSSHKKALTYLDYGIRERVGFILLTGEVGSGKTTLIRNLIQRRYDRVVLAKVFNTRVTSEQLLSMINDDFGLPVHGKDKVALMRELNDFLVQQFAAGNHPILIIDEAQNLDAELLEEVRMLSNLESSQSKLLQIVLVGQPELRETLAAPALLQLRQRISINCHLRALNREEIAEYIQHRLKVAGNASALAFTGSTLDLVHKYSRGIPRLINIFCDFILLSAFADESRTVTEAMVQDVVAELDFENHFWGAPAAPTAEVAAAAPQPAASAAPVAAAAPPLAAEAQSLLKEVAGRLDAMERDVSQRVPAALENVCDSIAALKGEIAAQATRHEAQESRQETVAKRYEEQVTELRRQVDTLSSAVSTISSVKPEPPAKAPSLGRWLMDGISGCGGKK